MVKLQHIANTKIVPTAVNADDDVLSFRIGNVAFTGNVLQIGYDGNLYAVFPDSGIAELVRLVFAGYRISCFGNVDNAYRIPTVH